MEARYKLRCRICMEVLMTKRMALYEAAKILLLFVEIVCIGAICFGIVRLLRSTVRLIFAMAPIGYEKMMMVADSVPDKLGFLRKILLLFISKTTKQEALRQMLLYGLVALSGVLVLMPCRLVLRHLEVIFKQRFMPDVLKKSFTDFSYTAKRETAKEEPLCEMGLLSRMERYYTANSLEGLYRDCWVASQEIACGGVYTDHYASHRVKVRGQWLTIRLNRDFNGTVILESRNTKNRFSHQALAGKMAELSVDHQQLAAQFSCYTDSVEDAKALLTVDMADKILSMLDRYPDICVFFRQSCMHVLIRKRSFNRRWELACPFCYPQLRREAARLYGSLQEFTDLLLD